MAKRRFRSCPKEAFLAACTGGLRQKVPEPHFSPSSSLPSFPPPAFPGLFLIPCTLQQQLFSSGLSTGLLLVISAALLFRGSAVVAQKPFPIITPGLRQSLLSPLC